MAAGSVNWIVRASGGRKAGWPMVILMLVLIASCAIQQPAPVNERGRPAGELDGGLLGDLALPPDPSDFSAVPKSTPETAAVVALLADADKKVMANELDGAAETLERALRIEPKNGLLWSKLAAVRYQQELLEQAEQLARKSNLFAAGDPYLQAYNWQLIAKVRRLHGDDAGAENALERSRELR